MKLHEGNLGYLTYNSIDESVTIPNKEVSQEYVNALSTMNWNGGASIPAKATNAFLFLKRRTSPISAIRAGPVTGPAPSIRITTSYSGSIAANR